MNLNGELVLEMPEGFHQNYYDWFKTIYSKESNQIVNLINYVSDLPFLISKFKLEHISSKQNGKKNSSQKNKNETIINTKEPCLILFYADWCQHCREYKIFFKHLIDSIIFYINGNNLTKKEFKIFVVNGSPNLIKDKIGGSIKDASEKEKKDYMTNLVSHFGVSGFPTLLVCFETIINHFQILKGDYNTYEKTNKDIIEFIIKNLNIN